MDSFTVFFINYLVLNGPITHHGQKPVNGGRSSTSEVVQDVLGLPERRLALLRRLLGQSFGGVGSSEQLIGRLLHRKRKQFCVLWDFFFFPEKLLEALIVPELTCCSLLPLSSSLRTSCSLGFRSSRRLLYSFSVLSISLSTSAASFLILLASS